MRTATTPKRPRLEIGTKDEAEREMAARLAMRTGRVELTGGLLDFRLADADYVATSLVMESGRAAGEGRQDLWLAGRRVASRVKLARAHARAAEAEAGIQEAEAEYEAWMARKTEESRP